MGPYALIFISALIGLFGWGFKGLIIGAVGAHLAAIIFGVVLTSLSGGLLPRKVRKKAASDFVARHEDLIRAAFPKTPQGEYQRTIEKAIERIFERAMADNKSADLLASMTLGAIQSATASIISEEQGHEMKTLLSALGEHIERDMYLSVIA